MFGDKSALNLWIQMESYRGVRDLLAMHPMSPPPSLAASGPRPRQWFRAPDYSQRPSFDRRQSLDRPRLVSLMTDIRKGEAFVK